MALVYIPVFTKSAEQLRSALIAQSLDKGVGISPNERKCKEKSQEKGEELRQI